MKEVSLILRSNLLLTIEEFKILERYSHSGKIWSLIHRTTWLNETLVIREKAHEYIFDPESLTFFCIVSSNILATWDTEATKNLRPDDEFHLKDTLFIKPYPGKHI